MLDVETEMIVDAHILVRHPDQSEQRDEISAPARVEELEASYDQEQRSNIMAEAIFAGEQVEKFASGQTVCLLGLLLAIVARLTKDFLMSNRPGDAGDGDRQDEQPHKLKADRHGEVGCGVRGKRRQERRIKASSPGHN
jgi:hypothetical protein